jgi:hypothetical protein
VGFVFWNLNNYEIATNKEFVVNKSQYVKGDTSESELAKHNLYDR